MTTIEHLPASAGAAEVVAALKSNGAVIVDDLVAPEALDRIAAEMEPFVAATPFGGDEFSGTSTKRTGGLIARSPAARELVQHPLMLDAARGLLDHATNIQLHLTQIISIHPGAAAQGIHRDQWAFDFHPFPTGFDVQCNTIWAMDDFTEENGATRVVPGSHLAEDRQHFTLDDSIPAEMGKGSVLVYSGSVYHGGGANRSAATRRALNLTYNVAWLRQEENQYLSVPPDIARELPDALLALMGYSLGAYALGYVDDVRDPLAALRGEATATAGFGGTDLSVSEILADKARGPE